MEHAEPAVKGIVGQTLRIYNDDSVAHELHTNGQPFRIWRELSHQAFSRITCVRVRTTSIHRPRGFMTTPKGPLRGFGSA